MEGGGGGGGGGGGPAPFLIKTYDMVDDSSTDEIVSWTCGKNSFVVWNPPEFARLLLPTYFKHNNFSSFIRQLNTYGFRKIDPERWEFANEDFIKDQKHLLKNIHRRKPIHSHTHPPQGSLADSEKAALDEEIERLSRDKTTLQTDLWSFRQHDSGTKFQLQELETKVQEMEQRQLRMMNFLTRAVRNPTFVEHMTRMAASSMFFSPINKKRRLPKGDKIQQVPEAATSVTTSEHDFGHIFHRDFSSKLTLELSPAVSDNHLLSSSVQSSNEDGASPQKKTSDEGVIKDSNIRTEGLLFAPETLELSDTGTSFSLRKDSLLPGQAKATDLSSLEEGDAHISCHLNLTLASSLLQANDSQYAAKLPHLSQPDESRHCATGRETYTRVSGKNRNFIDDGATTSSSQEAPTNNPGPAPAPGRVNDLFWEQFLTERPGSSDTEETSSCLRTNSYEDEEERNLGNEKSWRNRKDMEQLTL